MGRAPCCDEKLGLKKGPWTPDEDHKLVTHIQQHGHGSWRALPAKAGLKRCGKSCRLRWTNYLRPDIKRGRFSFEEDRMIIQLHAILGNRWSAIASHLPRRTDNEIKNYWNTHLKKRLIQMGIDPITHKTTSSLAGNLAFTNPPWTPLLSTQLTHMTQWDLTLAEAEARLSRHTNPFLKPFTASPSMHPSAFFMRSWKTNVEDSLKPKFGTVKLEPQFNILHQVWGAAPVLQNSGAMADMGLGAQLSTCVAEDSETFLPSDHFCDLSGGGRSDNIIHPGLVIDHFQNQISPSSILHGPDSDATSPCGSSSGISDCFDLVLHQSSSSFQNFPVISGNADQEGTSDTFWQRQHAAMVEALQPDGVHGDVGDGHSEPGLELIVPLDFNNYGEFPQFEIMCQGEQYQADCVP